MGHHTDQLGTIDKFKAPWESETGVDVEIDPVKLKGYLFNLHLDKAKAQDARDEAAEKVTKAEKDFKAAKDEVAKGDPTGKIAELTEALDKAETAAKKAQGDLDRTLVGVEKGLTPAQAARLVGSTKEELEADADKILEDFGVKPTTNEDETDEEREEREEKEAEAAELAAAARQTPSLHRGVVNPADPAGGTTGGEPDYEKIVAGMSNRIRI